MDSVPPCTVCGGTDLNLVDGYYYCTECGTQDQTIRETVIEYATREDGTFAFHTQTKKITADKDARDLSPEWYKWHAYNFMMAGFADELSALGAGEGFKPRLLWLWSKYVRAYRKREDDSTNEDTEKERDGNNSDSDSADIEELDATKNNPTKSEFKTYRIQRLIMPVMQAMLYAALNISDSELQVGDLKRFIREERVSCRNCLRFVPPDLDFHKLQTSDRCLDTASNLCDTVTLRGYAMTLIKELNLGKPVAANLHKLVSRYVTELCLPLDFKELVFSLMHFIPVSLEVDFLYGIPRTPNYEGVAMAYIVIALKICFGLDDTYDNMLSEAVNQYNDIHDLPKAYKYSLFMTDTDRLFSFREWCIHMEFRKKVIAKYYFPAAVEFNEDIDSQVFISHTDGRARKNNAAVDVSDDIMMEILARLNADVDHFKTPKVVFPSSLTPMATYTDFLLTKINDPLVKELLGEDFSQYTIKYITSDLEISETPLAGISEDNFIVSQETKATKMSKFAVDKKMVYVRNCENDNWLTTKPPTIKHVSGNDEEDCVSTEDRTRTTIPELNGIRDVLDNEQEDSNINQVNNKMNELVLNVNTENIFHDNFHVSERELWGSFVQDDLEDSKVFQSDYRAPTQINYDIGDESLRNEQTEAFIFDPETFDREAAIELLLQTAQKEHKIDIATKPKQKRKLFVTTGGYAPKVPGEPKEKIKRTCARPGEAMAHVETIKQLFYKAMMNRSKYTIDIEADNKDDVNDELAHSIDRTLPEPESVNAESEIIENETKSRAEDVMDKTETNLNETEIQSVHEENDEIIDNAETVMSKNFDEKTHDTQQLYLKVKEGDHNETTEVKEDTEIIDLLRQKEQELLEPRETNFEREIINNSKRKKIHNNRSTIGNNDEYVSESEIPLIEIINQLKQTEHMIKEFKRLRNKDGFRPYKYWMLHYWRNYPPQAFDKELHKRFSKSFTWTIKLCASVIESSTRSLYLQVMNLENELNDAIQKNLRKK